MTLSILVLFFVCIAMPRGFAVYCAAVVSPCDGQVVDLRDGLPDLGPPQSDAENPAGNFVVVACDGLRVELAHLQPGSIEVEIGDTRSGGARIASVGNSGNSTEPHLHIHAVDARGSGGRNGAGVPIAFDGVFPVRNRTFRH